MAQAVPIVTTLAEQLIEIARRYGIRDVYAFGSRAGELRRRVSGLDTAGVLSSSDADIAVQPMPGRALSAHDRVRLTDDLEVLLAAPRVDLVVVSEAPPLLAVEVIRGELLYTADPVGQAEHELYVLRRAADLAPFMRDRVHRVLTTGAR